MKKLLFLLLSSLFLFTPCFASITIEGVKCGDNTVNNDYYAWQFDAANMDQSSPANVGTFLLDPVDHGDVINDSGNFEFEDGTPVKFYGTNFTFSDNVPAKTEASWIADYLAFFGCNVVRVHHCDNFYPMGILTNDGTTQTMDPTGFDRFDYLWSKLKAKGIYGNFNLIVFRPWTSGDGVADIAAVKEISSPVKAVNIFDARMIELQKDYAYKFLHHINPYTGVSYTSDRIVAMLEITNENSLITHWHDKHLDPINPYTSGEPFPSFYTDELNTKWNNWLENKYETPAAIISAWGLASLDGTQTQIFDHSSTGSLQVISPAAATFTYGSGSATINITTVDLDNFWYIQYQKGFNQIATKVYQWDIVLSADSPRKVVVNIQGDSPTYTIYGSKTLDITTTPTTYSFYCTATISTHVTAKIHLGQVVGIVTVGAMSMKESSSLPYIAVEKDKTDFTFHRPYYETLLAYPAPQQADVTEFMNKTVSDFYIEMTDYIRNTVGVGSKLIIPNGGGEGYYSEDILTPISDVWDMHTYADHPQFPRVHWDSNDFTITNNRMLSSPTKGMVGNAHGKEQTVKTKPFTIGEYNHCFPNDYAYEGNLMMAIYGLQYGWNGLFQFSFGDATTDMIDNINGYFSADNNPQKMLEMLLGSYIFQKATNWSFTDNGDVLQFDSDQIKGVFGSIGGHTYNLGGISITPEKNGAVFIFSSSNQTFANSSNLVVVVFGKVKNTGSGWLNNVISAGNYQWGTTPVLMEFNPVDFSMAFAHGMTVRKLDTKGTPSDNLNLTVGGSTVTFNNDGIKSPWFVISK